MLEYMKTPQKFHMTFYQLHPDNDESNIKI